MATVKEVTAFLQEIKAKVKSQELDFVPRNLQSLATLGMSYEHAEDVILGLTFENYSKGPEDDHNGSPGAIWVFGEMVRQTTIYIKLKLDGGHALCLSFHAAESPLRYPLRTS